MTAPVLIITFILSLYQNVQLCSSCPKESLAVYEVRLETFWHRRDFPKHYPEWRPPASWSKTLGFSHDSSFEIFRKGMKATQALKQFAETADSSLLDLHTQGSYGVFDAANIAPLKAGVGDEKMIMSADGNHSKVSLVTKILPSPDWFVGVDSYDLCPNGRWLEYVHLEVDPLDAGTDNGLTFTSPNWPTNPQETIQPITAHFPDHPAGSFYYPELDDLPVLAQFTITKQREYALQDKFDAADHNQLFVEEKRDIYRYKVDDEITSETETTVKKHQKNDVDRLENQVNYISSNQRRQNPQRKVNPPKILPAPDQENAIAYKGHHQHRKKSQGRYRTTRRPNLFQVTEPGLNSVDQTPAIFPPVSTLNELKSLTSTPIDTSLEHSEHSKEMRRSKNNHKQHKNNRKRIPSGDVMAVIDDIVKDYQKEHRKMIKKRRREERKKRRENMKRIKPPRDCQVSEWTEWSACTKSCGIGEQTRRRTVLKHSRRGGKPCPVLEETTWCGSARACPRDYFNWS